jgi:HNH endonuclease
LGRDPGLRNIPNWEFMEIGDYVMCVYGATYQYVSRLLAKHDNEDFAKAVWGRDERGRTWQLMYFLTEPVEVGRRLSDFGNYLEPERYWGFTRVEDERIGTIVSSFGSVVNFVSEMLGREAGDLPAQLSVERIRGRRVAESSLRVDRIANGDVEEEPGLDSEGRRRLALHVEYERKPRNRRRAIEVHGTACKVCGFDFDEVYGSEYAESYIEIHHLKPLSAEEGVVDPRTDLVPLCANCHKMAHKRRSSVTPIDKLKELLTGHGQSSTVESN